MARLGRPTEIPDRTSLRVYLSRAEQRAVARLARSADVSSSAWVRALVLTALRDRTGKTQA